MNITGENFMSFHIKENHQLQDAVANINPIFSFCLKKLNEAKQITPIQKSKQPTTQSIISSDNFASYYIQEARKNDPIDNFPDYRKLLSESPTLNPKEYNKVKKILEETPLLSEIQRKKLLLQAQAYFNHPNPNGPSSQQITPNQSITDETEKVPVGNYIQKYYPRFFFSQNDFESHHESNNSFSEDAIEAIKQFNGLCQSFCNLVVLLGHESPEIKALLDWQAFQKGRTEGKEHYDKCFEILNNIALKQHIVFLSSEVEKNLATQLDLYPESLLTYTEQQTILSFDEQGIPRLNKKILERVLNDIENNTYIQFSTISFTEEKEKLKEFENGHATLIFKTDDTEYPYQFFNPEFGFIKFRTVDELHKELENQILDYKDLHLEKVCFIDPKPILMRSRYCEKLLAEKEQSTSSTSTYSRNNKS